MVRNPLSLYFHIPFCEKKCPYCHFYVVPNNSPYKEAFLKSLLLEWKKIFPLVQTHEIVSIYFGGGTPTLFGPKPIEILLSTIKNQATLSQDCEITLEANPEDVTLPLMNAFKMAGINRVSIGVQSLVDDSLYVLGRIHNSRRALEAIELTVKAGIENLTIDLMYELPDQTCDSFEKTLTMLKNLPITHLSLYNLTIEPHTPFSKRKLNLPLPEEGLKMLQSATSHLETMGLKRYEISAFAKPGFESKHNVGYWTARPFFGLGPSAFSYYNGSRFQNCCHLKRYIDTLNKDESPIDFEELLPYPQNVHELLAVELRLIRGVDLSKFQLPKTTVNTLKRLMKEGYLDFEHNHVKLSEKGLLFYDMVASEII